MDFAWAAQIDQDQRREAGRMRMLAGIEIGETDDSFWLRGPSGADEAIQHLLMIPRARLFHLQDGVIRPWGKRLAVGNLPDITFVPIAEAILPALPVAAFPAARVDRICVSMIRSSQARAATILLTSASEWFSYATSAPGIRLNRWDFACAEDGRVLVRGEPLPPLPGQLYYEVNSVAMPVGWTCSPAIEGAVLSQLVAADDQSLVLLAADGTAETILQDEFVRATRSAVRQTFSTISIHER